jgi:hypothetical protein
MSIVSSGNVLLIDPNDVNINTNLINGIPKYEDMYIHAELVAIRRGRTVLNANVSPNDKLVFGDGNQDKTVTVNFLGVNQNTNSSNYLNFTSNWYDNNNDLPMHESFGITRINVKVNSSFIPQVDIDFVDVRGASFFNSVDSPYRILFDFPPPIFELTIKGYYGKALSYKLHLVSYTNDFNSENGNFVINAKFIAMTYAPLTDVLFRYVINNAIIVDGGNYSSDPKKEPVNIYELALKIKDIYSAVPDKIKNDVDKGRYDSAQKKIELISNCYSILNGFKNDSNIIDKIQNPLILLKDEGVDEDFNNIQIIKSFGEYDTIIKNKSVNGIPTTMEDRLIIGASINSEVSTTTIFNGDTYTNEQLVDAINNALDNYKKELINKINTTIKNDKFIVDSDILFNKDGKNKGIFSTIKIENGKNVGYVYVGIDITNVYLKLYKENTKYEEEKSSALKGLNETINSMVEERLGMTPTIYNIFKIILNDVDKFFTKLRIVSENSEKHHTDDFKNDIIDSSYKDVVGDKIYAFPLVVKTDRICNKIKQEKRIAPIDVSNKLSKPFPELEYIDEFIKSFALQNALYENTIMKSEVDEKGNFKWIPFTPSDSIIVNSNQNSPYNGIDIVSTGNQKIDLSNTNKLDQIYKTLLTRFYILTQNAFKNEFNSLVDNEENKAFINLFAKSEAINLANSIKSQSYSDSLILLSESSVKNVESSFFDIIKTRIPDTYNFSDSTNEFFDITNGEKLYVNRKNPNYIGFKLKEYDVVKRENNEDKTNDLINDFFKDTKTSFWKKLFGKGNVSENYDFTKENVIYIPDNLENNGDSKFLVSTAIYSSQIDSVDTFLTKGNAYFSVGKNNDAEKLKSFGNFYKTWAKQISLGHFDVELKKRNKVSALILISNFGESISPFNRYPNGLNEYVFKRPAVIECPYFLGVYMGALVNMCYNNDFYNDVYEYVTNGNGKWLSSGGGLMFADYRDINNLLSTKDREQLLNIFDDFYLNYSDDLFQNVNNLIDRIKTELPDGSFDDKSELCEKYLREEYDNIYKTLFEKRIIANYNEITFNLESNDETHYSSIETLKNENNSLYIKRVLPFFKTFFSELNKALKDNKNKLKDSENETKKLTGDEDIITQTYYSFKNINDKWLTDIRKLSTGGYPFNKEGKNLIDSFAFVDRAMNPIGDTIINPEILIDLVNNNDISVFSVLSQLLSLNGFEFFPLQNFMSYNIGDWENSFKIDSGVDVKFTPSFVCMLVGGSSSYVSGIEGNGLFKDDGVIDLSIDTPNDFTVNDCEANPDNDEQITNNKEFPYQKVRAFRVRFGEQNQSMFKDIKIDSKEYPETNESIQILSRLAGDNKDQAPIPKGQNLYNIYENRSYKATVNSLGNAMIQPTQYFQLENIPLYNGAYIILGVEHNIVPNKMDTSFWGTKILKYPIPRVLSSASIFGFEEGSTAQTNSNLSKQNTVSMGVGTASNPEQAKYNSMYTLLI